MRSAVPTQAASLHPDVLAQPFHKEQHGSVRISGTISGGALQVQISATGSNSYTFKAQRSGANLSGIANQVAVTLTIGVDLGTTEINVQIS